MIKSPENDWTGGFSLKKRNWHIDSSIEIWLAEVARVSRRSASPRRGNSTRDNESPPNMAELVWLGTIKAELWIKESQIASQERQADNPRTITLRTRESASKLNHFARDGSDHSIGFN
jgi:hypothetical protein